LLLENKNPSADQQAKIDDLAKMVGSGEMKKEHIYGLVKQEVSSVVSSAKLSRYSITKALKRAPKLIPSITKDDLHKMIWEKVSSTLKDTLDLRVGTLAPEGTAWLEVPRKILSKHLKKVSNGKVRLKMYTGGVMGEDVDILRKMDLGQLDGCGCTALGVFKAAPEMAVFSLPMLFKNYKEVDYILGKFRGEFDASLKKRGYILASLIDTGFFYLWTKNNVSSLADIKKQRIMTWFGKVETTTFEELGISPTPVSVPEIVTSLNTGLVNGNYGPGPWILGTQAYTNYKNYIAQPLFYSPAAIIFSTKIQDKMKDEYPGNFMNNLMEILVQETTTFERLWIDKHLRPYESKSMKAFRDYGIKPVSLSASDMATIEAASKRVWTKLAGDLYPKSLLDRVLKELENFRKNGK
jgi:TRAP-type C4-dicarboxylate transport system substrate-binding protein